LKWKEGKEYTGKFVNGKEEGNGIKNVKMAR